MKASEIQIGDWIHHMVYLHGNDNPPYETNLQVKNIYGSEINCDVEGYEIISGTRLSECTPIPLTPEILEKNGWKWRTKYDIKSLKIFSRDNHCLMSLTYGNKISVGGHEKEIKYVHELQHALRLCGLDELANNIQI